MWVLHEGSIPFSKINKVVVLDECDKEVLKEVLEISYSILMNYKGTLPFLKEITDYSSIVTFLNNVIMDDSLGYRILVCYVGDKPSGVCLVSLGRPWYASEGVVFINEECTVAFGTGLGLSRALAYSLETYHPDNVKCIMFSNANTPCADKVYNTFTKKLKGFNTYTTFYKTFIK